MASCSAYTLRHPTSRRGYLDRNNTVKLELAATLPNRKQNGPFRVDPALTDGVPDGEIIARQNYIDRLPLTRLEHDVREPLQNRGGFISSRWVMQI